MRRLQVHLPQWMQEWLEVLIPGLQIFLIIIAAWLLHRLCKRLISQIGQHYALPRELLLPLHGICRWVIIAATVLLALERLGVSATVLWTAFTGFATVGAVAFFAAWSVLSNLFCAFLIFTVGPFRLGDHIELLDTAEKPGALGRVVDINLLYTTLEDITASTPGSLLQIPNALVFQRVLRRWRAGTPVPPERLLAHQATKPASAPPAADAPAPKSASFP